MVVISDTTEATAIIMEKKKNKKRKLVDEDEGSPSSKSGNEPQGQLLEGMSAAEVTMIRRLAGNDPILRKKTIRKLKKWLTVVIRRFPDNPDSRTDIEPNLIRVWKALFYCMWMADKPLPQEQLAEQISDLVQIFVVKPNALLVFVEWFFRTMSREWSWIDRYRLDKFMMLFRRFLRKTLAALADRKWKADVLEGFLKIIRIYIFNNHPSTKFKKGTGASVEPYTTCPIGLQVHFIDIFLEELAKVDADRLTSTKVLKLLSPFVEEMSKNSDDRILDEITLHIFHHLMKQSDVGIDYQEGLMQGGELEDMEDSDSDDKDSLGDEDENSGESGAKDGSDDEECETETDIGPLDPRAGAVDVVLPQLQIDYAILADKLTEAGGCKTVRKRNRGKLYTLASHFRDLVQGVYPLALPEEEQWTPAIPKKEVQKATERLLELGSRPDGPKKRKTKKQRQREAKRQQDHDESVGSEDTSAYLNDEELMDHVSDNYSSYVHEQMKVEPSSQEGTASPPKKKKSKKAKTNDGSHENETETSESPPKPKKKKKKVYQTIVEFEADEIDSASSNNYAVDLSTPVPETFVDIPLLKKQKNRASISTDKALVQFNMDDLDDDEMPELQPIKKNRKHKSLSPNFAESTKNGNQILLGVKAKKKETNLNFSLSGLVVNKALKKKIESPSTPNSAGYKKRVNFVLAINREHEATDYMSSISKSPAIPFDARRTPTFGVLKTVKKKSAIGTHTRSLSPSKNSPRKRALEFF